MNSKARLQGIAAIVAAVRQFFESRGVTEVFTPALSPATATDPAIASLSCQVAVLGSGRFLHTSPEHAMKQLLANGSGDIYQLARVFRDGELGRWHAPEFMLLEWYRTGIDDRQLMDETWELLSSLFHQRNKDLNRLDISYADAFGAQFGIDPHHPDTTTRQAIGNTLRQHGIEQPDGLTDDGLLDLALSTVVVPAWPANTAVFLHDYPASQAALARIRDGLAARFEVFINGVELGNGYYELDDPAEQRRRFEQDLATRRASGLPDVPIDEALLGALEKGLPDCAGIAIGMDRLIALLTEAGSLSELSPPG